MSPSLIALLNPHRDLLPAMLAEEVDESMLRDIAELDYGSHAPDNLEKLLALRRDGSMDVPMRYPLREVLNLSRWSAPDSHDWKPGKASYIQRAFCCAALVKAGSFEENWDYFEGESLNIAILIDSLDALGPAYQRAAISFFSWRQTTFSDPEVRPLLWLAILRYALFIWPDLKGKYVIEIVDTLLQTETDAWTHPAIIIRREKAQQWLFRLTDSHCPEEYWRAFAGDLRNAASAIEQEARTKILQIAALLEGEPAQTQQHGEQS